MLPSVLVRASVKYIISLANIRNMPFASHTTNHAKKKTTMLVYVQSLKFYIFQIWVTEQTY